MTTLAVSRPRLRPRMRHLAWLPAVALVAWGLMSAAGVSLTDSSNAANTATVSANVALDIHIAGTCTTGASFGPIALALGDNSMATCGVTFGTNNGTTGATLKVANARVAPAGNSFCTAAVALTCGATSFADVGPNAAALAAGQFGVLSTVTTCTTPTWLTTTYNPVRDLTTTGGVGDTICFQNAGATDGNYSLDFHANRAAGTTAGTYQTRADFTVQAS